MFNIYIDSIGRTSLLGPDVALGVLLAGICLERGGGVASSALELQLLGVDLGLVPDFDVG